MTDCAPHAAGPANRRGFLKQTIIVVIGTVLSLVPLGAGLAVLLDPLRRRSAVSTAIRVATIDAVPDDGTPVKFPVLATRVDAWNKSAEMPIGAVYLRRAGSGKIEALNVVCPHAGCFVDYVPQRKGFLCPCHNSSFNPDGRIADRASPAPRPMDSLPVEIRNQREIWVQFQNFEAGRPDRVPVA